MVELAYLRAAISDALRTHDGPGAASVVADLVARALPGEGAAVTLMSSDHQRQTLVATDPVAAAIEQAQYTVGEGPSLDALTSRKPVLVPDLSAPLPRAAWPGLTDQLAGLPVGAVFAFLMRLGATPIGVTLCYRRRVGDLDPDETRFALRASDMLTLALLHAQGERADTEAPDDWLGQGTPGTRAIHQATGMVMVQLGGVTTLVAFVRLRAHAFAHGHTLQDVAADVVAGRLILQADTGTPP